MQATGTFRTRYYIKINSVLTLNIACSTIFDSGAEEINMKSIPDWYGPSTLSFFALDDVGCNGSESNLLNCLPQHNCGTGSDKLIENAGVQCLRKGMEGQN